MHVPQVSGRKLCQRTQSQRHESRHDQACSAWITQVRLAEAQNGMNGNVINVIFCVYFFSLFLCGIVFFYIHLAIAIIIVEVICMLVQ